MSAHTSGPWTINPISVTTVNGAGIVVAACGQHSNNRRDLVEMHNELCANARLIAAAPDMLAALHKCVAQLEMITGMVHDERAALIDARAALVKATGSA